MRRILVKILAKLDILKYERFTLQKTNQEYNCYYISHECYSYQFQQTTDTDTLLMEVSNQPLMTNIFIQNFAKVSVPLLWSRVQVQGKISVLDGGTLSLRLSNSIIMRPLYFFILMNFFIYLIYLLVLCYENMSFQFYGALRISNKF